MKWFALLALDVEVSCSIPVRTNLGNQLFFIVSSLDVPGKYPRENFNALAFTELGILKFKIRLLM